MDCISDKITVSEDIGVYMWQSLGRRAFLFLANDTTNFCPYSETRGSGFIALHIQFVFAGPNCSELSREAEVHDEKSSYDVCSAGFL